MRYIVKGTHLKHDGRDYAPGKAVELSEEEAAPLAHHLEPIEGGEEPIDDGEDAEEGKKRRRK